MSHTEICLVCKGRGCVPAAIQLTTLTWICPGCSGCGWVMVSDAQPQSAARYPWPFGTMWRDGSTMLTVSIACLFALLLAAPASAQLINHPPRKLVGQLGACSASGINGPRYAIVTDGAGSSDCTTGGGAEIVACWCDGSTWTAFGGAGGSDDQTAAEVPITDAGAFYSGAEVEAALQEIGPALTDARTPLAHAATHGVAGADPVTITEAQISDLVHTVDTTETTFAVRKGSAGTINKGDVVYVSGYNLGLDVPEVELADASSVSTLPAIGIAMEEITAAQTGDVLESGNLTGVDTSSFSVGDGLYVSETPGPPTNVRPVGAALVQKIGEVLRANPVNGAILVIGAGRTNDLPNLADDSLWIGDSSGVAAAAALPDCTDGGGGSLNYTASTNSVSCGSDDTGTDTLDDLSDDDLGTLQNVTETGEGAGVPLVGDGAGGWAPGTVADGSVASTIARDSEVPSLETDPGVPLLALADYGDVCAGSEAVRRNSGDTANECYTPAAGGGTAGSGTELQATDGAGGHVAVTSSSVSGASVTLGGALTLPTGGSASAPSLAWGSGIGAYEAATNRLFICRPSGANCPMEFNVGGGGGILGSLTNGKPYIDFVSAVGYSWKNDTDTALIYNGANDQSLVAGGVAAVRTTATKVTIIGAGFYGLLATAPATCTVGDLYSDTSGALCFCSATNTWSIAFPASPTSENCS